MANSLNYLLAKQGMCYVAKSHLPPGSCGLFGFRIDTDFDSPGCYPSVVSLSHTAGIPFTWFLNIEAHEGFLADAVNGLAGQDVQLHCYRHVVHADYDSNRRELAAAMEFLSKHSIVPVGAAGPFGDWNETWTKALADYGFRYSSEFGIAYDDIPFRPIVEGAPSQVLQVPVHPVCLGRLRAARANSQQIRGYLKGVARRQASRNEPCFVYGHPENVACHANLMAKLLDELLAICGGGSTLTEYAAWWLKREHLDYRVVQDVETITLDVARPSHEVGIRIVKGDLEALVPAVSGRLRSGGLQWRQRGRYVPTKSEIAGSVRPGRLAALREWRRRHQRQTTRKRGDR